VRGSKSPEGAGTGPRQAALREAVTGLTELATLLKQSVRDQKAGEKEIHQVRQTLRSLQSVRI
jgi:hypothetical protein